VEAEEASTSAPAAAVLSVAWVASSEEVRVLLEGSRSRRMELRLDRTPSHLPFPSCIYTRLPFCQALVTLHGLRERREIEAGGALISRIVKHWRASLILSQGVGSCRNANRVLITCDNDL
jgi:hypothetical protein